MILGVELTGLFELLVRLLGINGVPCVVDDEQEVGYTPTIHPAGSGVRKRKHSEYTDITLSLSSFHSGFYSPSFAL